MSPFPVLPGLGKQIWRVLRMPQTLLLSAALYLVFSHVGSKHLAGLSPATYTMISMGDQAVMGTVMFTLAWLIATRTPAGEGQQLAQASGSRSPALPAAPARPGRAARDRGLLARRPRLGEPRAAITCYRRPWPSCAGRKQPLARLMQIIMLPEFGDACQEIRRELGWPESRGIRQARAGPPAQPGGLIVRLPSRRCPVGAGRPPAGSPIAVPGCLTTVGS